MADERSASMLELKTVDVPQGSYDVAILGGGLAGLTMALHLKRDRPETRVLVVDRRAEPAPEAAFKVGESSVEIGAHYYRNVVGMRDHLEQQQIRKLGLRFFLPAGDNTDITKRVEFCTPGHLDAFTHQIDRGRFENELFRRARKAGADAYRGWRVTDVELGDDESKITMSTQDDETASVTARWVVDATGRGNFLRRKLDLHVDSGHHCNAAWFRLAGGLDIEDFTDDEEWLDRMPERGLRKYSTSHLIKPGYWLWLIQLASGPISIGACVDPRFYPYEEINTLEAFLEWMKRNEPQLHAEIEGRHEDIMDFLRVRDFSYASSRVFSAKPRWTLLGEAAGFLDALYSPGSDFIGFTNTFSAELIERDLDGEDVTELVEFYNDTFLNLFNTTAHLYRDNYQLFGNPQVMVAKFVFNSSVYFAGIGNAFCHDRMRKPEDLETLIATVGELIELVPTMEQLFRDWNELEQRQFEGVSVMSKQLTPYIEAQRGMSRPADGDEVFEISRQAVPYVKALAVWIFHRAARNLSTPPDENRPINLKAISLHPERWEQDGLYAEEGISLVQAREMLPGIEEIDLEASGAVAAA
jgi:flavin-dependent dehydrogenase